MITDISISLQGFVSGSAKIDPTQDSLTITLAPYIRGNDAVWEALTQAQYDALNPKDPETLYLIVD